MNLTLDIKKFVCPDCGACEMNKDFMNALQTIQFGMGEGLVVTSGFRCAIHNKAIGGSPTSKHLLGLAADIACPDAEKRMILVSLAVRNRIKGIGIGKTFTHLDMRTDTPVLWTYPIDNGSGLG